MNRFYDLRVFAAQIFVNICQNNVCIQTMHHACFFQRFSDRSRASYTVHTSLHQDHSDSAIQFQHLAHSGFLRAALPQDEVDMAQLVACAPEKPEVMRKDIEDTIDNPSRAASCGMKCTQAPPKAGCPAAAALSNVQSPSL